MCPASTKPRVAVRLDQPQVAMLTAVPMYLSCAGLISTNNPLGITVHVHLRMPVGPHMSSVVDDHLQRTNIRAHNMSPHPDRGQAVACIVDVRSLSRHRIFRRHSIRLV